MMRGSIAWLTVCFLGTLALNYAQLTAPVADTLPGEPGKDYPIHAEIPNTSFSCQKQPFPGYYADVGSNCQAYHLCGDGGNQTSFLCPNGTIFNQATQTCDEWYKVDCKLSPQLFWRNKYFDGESKNDESTKKRDSNVEDDANTNGLKENNSSWSEVSENGDNLKWKKIQDLIDSEITKVLYRKQFESRNLNSSLDIETSFKNLRESMNNGNSTQFKESLDGIISSRIEAMRDSIRLNNMGNDRALINEEQSEKMDSQKKAKTAEKIFTLLSYVDKIKTTLTDHKSSKSASSIDKTKSEILPRFGEKLFKMLSTLEKKQDTTKTTRVNENVNSRLNIENDVDFFDDYKNFFNNKEINEDKPTLDNTISRKEGENLNLNLNLNENTPQASNESTFNKDLNNSTKTELDFLSDEAAIGMIQRILDIAKKNLPPPTDPKVDDISKSIETSLVQDTPDTNVTNIVNNSTPIDSYHKNINDILNSYENSENNSISYDYGINSSNETDKDEITSHDSREISSSKESYEDDLSETYDYEEYSSDYDIDEVSNEKNNSVKNESNVDGSQGNTTNYDSFSENVNNTKPNDEIVSIVDVLDQNISNAENEESLNRSLIDSFDRNLSSEDIIDDNLNQNSSSDQNVNNDENINKKDGVHEELMRVQENVNDTIVLDDNSTSIFINENYTNTNNVSETNVDKEEEEEEEDSLVDKEEDTDNDNTINNIMGENNTNSSDTSNALVNEGLDAVLETSQGNLNDTETVMTDDNEEHNDELMGILKGIYSTIDQDELYRLWR